jgi:hypothetical protein
MLWTPSSSFAGFVVVEQALGRRTRCAAECFAGSDVMPRVKNSVSRKSFMPYNRT